MNPFANSLIIVIPCYNEYKRLNEKKYKSFLDQYDQAKIVFSDDGSTDNTYDILSRIRSSYPKKVFINQLSKNRGKAEAVRQGVLHCLNNELTFDKIAYLDADGSTSLEECYQISMNIKDSVKFAFGSRIMKIDTLIVRKVYRHFIGRFVATIISRQLDLEVYDTQCGCKVFETELARKIFNQGFISRWLFDVEIFHRIIKLYGKENMNVVCREVPLNSWIDTADSKVRISYFFKMWIDLISIKRKYK